MDLAGKKPLYGLLSYMIATKDARITYLRVVHWNNMSYGYHYLT
jgi:hypothetical protein